MLTAPSIPPSPTPTQFIALQGNAVEAAKALVRQKGYDPVVPGDPAQYATHTLRVLLGQKMMHDPFDQRAFFFVGDKYIGTDAMEPSVRFSFVSQEDTTVTLKDDAMIDPSGGSATVRFHWDGSKLVPLDPIPTADWKAPLSRR
jgi:hypothetical protein